MSSFKKQLKFRKQWLAIATKTMLLMIVSMGNATAAVQKNHPKVSVTTSNGQKLSGELVTLHGQFLELSTGGENQTLAFEQIGSVDIVETDSQETDSQISPATLQCQLTDGSRFNATNLTISDAEATLKLASGPTITLARSSLKALLLFDAANDPDKLQQWEEFVPNFSATSDAIIAAKNDALQAIEGIVEDVSKDGLGFQMGGRQVTVKAEKLTGVIFYRADREFENLVCEARLIDGSTIASVQIELSDGTFNIATATGDQVRLPLELVASLNLSAGRSIYLSDLLPTTNDWQPLVASQANLDSLALLNLSVANETFSGQPLSLRTRPTGGLNFLATTQIYDKGFAISGGARLAFNLNGQFKRLTALAGFDPQTAVLPGNVQIEIQVDNKTVISAVLENRLMAQPFPIDVDLADAKRLIIRVNYHDGRSVGDRIHLVDARLSR